MSPNRLHLPLPAEPRQAGLAGEELLHGGLFEVALLGDEPVQRAEQRIHIATAPRRWRVVRRVGGSRKSRIFPILTCSSSDAMHSAAIELLLDSAWIEE